MNKTELLALGLPEENLREFQRLYNRDLNKVAHRMVDNPERRADELRAAIVPMLGTIKNTDSLRAILATVTHHYLKNYREDHEKAAPGATNTKSGKAEQKSYEPLSPASSVPENKEECQA